MNTELTQTFLSLICSEVIKIFKASTYFSTALYDSVKNEIVVKTKAIDVTSLTIDRALAVFHNCEENVAYDNQEIEDIEGIFYIDVCRKINRKDGNIFDEVDKLAWTALCQLRQAPSDLNSNVNHWQFVSKRLWIPENQDLTNPILYVVCELKCKAFYSNQYSRIYGL